MNNYLEYFKYNQDVLDKLKKYYELLVEENTKYNLTSITEIEEVYIKHFYDSILLSKYIDNDKTLADVGTGAGFPGIPLKIVNPNLKVTLIEPTTKRANFLNMVIKELDLKDIKVINNRVEDISKDHLNEFDYVTARAVADSHILLELLSPITKVKGNTILLKGSNYLEELSNITNCLNKTYLKKTIEYKEFLPYNYGERNIIFFEKTKESTLWDLRTFAQIKKKPY